MLKKEKAASSVMPEKTAKVLLVYKKNSTNTREKKRLNKRSMLYPVAVLDRLGIRPGKANRGGYWILRCPYHKHGQEKKPSLHLHQVDGYFKCQACGERGDIIKFYMKVAKVTFSDAIKALGAYWEVK